MSKIYLWRQLSIILFAVSFSVQGRATMVMPDRQRSFEHVPVVIEVLSELGSGAGNAIDRLHVRVVNRDLVHIEVCRVLFVRTGQLDCKSLSGEPVALSVFFQRLKSLDSKPGSMNIAYAKSYAVVSTLAMTLLFSGVALAGFYPDAATIVAGSGVVCISAVVGLLTPRSENAPIARGRCYRDLKNALAFLQRNPRVYQKVSISVDESLVPLAEYFHFGLMGVR